MCRLLGYATAGFDLSLHAILGAQAVADYRGLSEIHNDGWGASLLSNPVEPADLPDGGAPSPETGTRLYRSTVAAEFDPVFGELAEEPARGALWHLRLASSNLPLILENQQPFFANGLSFIHNGDISDEQGRNIIASHDYPVDDKIFLSMGGRSDSAMFFAVILEYIGFGFALDEAVAQAVRELRQRYPKSSYNCMLQSQYQLIVLCAAGHEETASRVVEIYNRYGRGGKVYDYRTVRYRALHDENGEPAGVVAASSGFRQDEDEGWTALKNNEMLIASNRTGRFRLRSI
jgi:predicted glutamine amidotransferase